MRIRMRTLFILLFFGCLILLSFQQPSYSQNGSIPTRTQTPSPTRTVLIIASPTPTASATPTPRIYSVMLPVIQVPPPTPTFTETPTPTFTPTATPTQTATPTTTPTPTPHPYNVNAKDHSLRPLEVPSGWMIRKDEWEIVSPEESTQKQVWSSYLSEYWDDYSPIYDSHYLAGSDVTIYMSPEAAGAGIDRWVTYMQQNVQNIQVTVPTIGEGTKAFKSYWQENGTEYVEFDIIFRLQNIRIVVWTYAFRTGESIDPAIDYARLLESREPSTARSLDAIPDRKTNLFSMIEEKSEVFSPYLSDDRKRAK